MLDNKFRINNICKEWEDPAVKKCQARTIPGAPENFFLCQATNPAPRESPCLSSFMPVRTQSARAAIGLPSSVATGTSFRSKLSMGRPNPLRGS